MRKHEHGTTVFLSKPLEIDDERAEDGKKVIPLLRTFTVFHSTQIDGVPPFVSPKIEECPWQSDEAVQTNMRRSGGAVRVGGNRAFIQPIDRSH